MKNWQFSIPDIFMILLAEGQTRRARESTNKQHHLCEVFLGLSSILSLLYHVRHADDVADESVVCVLINFRQA